MIKIGSWRIWLTPDDEREREPPGSTPGGDAQREAQPSGGEIEIAWRTLAARLPATTDPCHRSKHAATYRTRVGERDVYLKRYHRYDWRTDLKDMVRPSKARRVLRVSTALAAAGFHVPRVLAAAEERHGPFLRGAWVATEALEGVPLADRLAALAGERAAAPTPAAARVLLAEKRGLLAALGAAVARFHAAGFVAGDLVPANVWLARSAAGDALAFLDHDRTRAGRAPARWWRARRNLVQLNRFVLTGVVATDRARVYRAYAAGRGWSRAEARRRLPWLIAKTIERRRRFDGVADAAALGFRALMRAAPAAAAAASGARAAADRDRR